MIAGGRDEPGEHLGELHAGQAGHVDVEEDDVVGDRLDELQGLDGVARLADDLDATRLAQQEAQLGARRCLVVDDECLEHPRLHQPSGSDSSEHERHGGPRALDALDDDAGAGAEVPPQSIVNVLERNPEPLRRAGLEHVRQPLRGNTDSVIAHRDAACSHRHRSTMTARW